MSPAEMTFQVLSNCLLLAVVLTFMRTFEPHRKHLLGRFFFFFARYTLPAGLLLLGVYWFAFGRIQHE